MRRSALSRVLAPLLISLAMLPLGTTGSLRAQEEATVEALAPLIQAEDARRWAPDVFRRGLENPEPLVRRAAATAIGRVGDRRGTPLLLEFLLDPDSTVQTSVIFALGLLRDSAAVAPLIGRFTAQPRLARDPALEAVTSLARIGGQEVAEFFRAVLRRNLRLTVDSTVPLALPIAQELWRLGRRAPAADLLPALRDTLVTVRRAAVYSLGRLREPAAAEGLQLALRDQDALVRSWAVRSLTRSYADTAGLEPGAVTGAITRLLGDDDDGVRVNALRALGTYRDSALASVVIGLLHDPDFNVRVQAAATLGALGGSAASTALSETARSREPWAVRREALLALARVDTARFRMAVSSWQNSAEWEDRMVAAQAWSAVPGGPQPARASLMAERDPRVIAVWLGSWTQAEKQPSPELLAAARRLLSHGDAAVRSVAADVLARVADPADITMLVQAYRQSARDSFPEAALSALAALDTIATGTSATDRVTREFLDAIPRPESYLVRAWAEANWPAAAERWGTPYPLETGRTLQDYRDLARRFILGPDSLRYPRVRLLTEQRGSVELELFGPDAPLTVANFLALVNRHYFDGNRWHRVVPDFVVQDGDRRGDGWGGPGGSPIRDEINRRRYGTGVLGMALSGPDTGGSQWFITLSPQPHLDGIYTIFGRVVSGTVSLDRVTQGDRITSIRP